MRLCSALSIFALSCAALAAGEKPHGGLPIAPVKSWTELAKQPVVELHKNATARFGIQALHGPRYSGVMLYCMTEAYDPEDDVDDSGGEKLGPFRLAVHKPGEKRMPADPNEKKSAPEPGKRDYGRLVFAQAIFLEALGTHVVELRNAKDVVVAFARIECTKAPFHAWSSLAPYEEAEKPENALESNPASIFQAAPGQIGFPKVLGNVPILYWNADGRRGAKNFTEDDPLPTVPERDDKPPAPLSAEQKKQAAQWIAELASDVFIERSDASIALQAMGPAATGLLRSAARQTPDAEALLRLRTIMARFDGAFHIELDGTDLVLQTKDSYLPADLTELLLARWWVNGKPVKPKAKRDVSGDTAQIAMEPSSITRIKLRIDSPALGAKSGDTIGLQMLLCPDGTQRRGAEPVENAPAEPMPENSESEEVNFSDHTPVLSNKIEFKAP